MTARMAKSVKLLIERTQLFEEPALWRLACHSEVDRLGGHPDAAAMGAAATPLKLTFCSD